MMTAAHRNCELVADLLAERSALREAKMVSVRRLPAADQTRARRNKFDMIAVTNTAGLRQRQDALVDRPWCVQGFSLPLSPWSVLF